MIGYEFLLSRIPLRMPPLGQPARVKPVTRVEEMTDMVAVPRHVAPGEGASTLDHVLFALKHEAIQLAILHEAINLLIQWIRQNNGRMPQRRKSAPEVSALEPQQIERIEAMVAESFAAAPSPSEREGEA